MQIEGRTLPPGDNIFEYDPPKLTREDVINHLTSKNGFKQLAPNTLMYSDERDTITVYLNPYTVIITADGPNVITTWEVIQVRPQDEYFYSQLLQIVLSKF